MPANPAPPSVKPKAGRGRFVQSSKDGARRFEMRPVRRVRGDQTALDRIDQAAAVPRYPGAAGVEMGDAELLGDQPGGELEAPGALAEDRFDVARIAERRHRLTVTAR